MITIRSQRKISIKTDKALQDAADAGKAAAKDKTCRACGDHRVLQDAVVPTLASIPLMHINPKHPDEDPMAELLQRHCWEAFVEASPLCAKCKVSPVFHRKMFAEPKLLEVAREAGRKAGREIGGCSVCYLSMHEDYIDGIIVPEIHPTKPLFKIGEYEGELVRALRKAFMDAYNDATLKCCSVCTPDDE
jgi:hypothetical protein